MEMTFLGKGQTMQPCVATIGSFDGVHRGHQYLIHRVMQVAHERGLESVVVTFANHPLSVLRPESVPQQLSPAQEKVERLREMGIDRVVLLDFSHEVAKMTAYEFMKKVMKERLCVKVLMIGYDNRFGHDGKVLDDYVGYGREFGIEVVQCDSLVGFSSTAARQALLSGDIETANSLLGYCYRMEGEVVEGFQNGRKIGYPTANLMVGKDKLVPLRGVYLARCEYGYGMLNIGMRPTLHNGKQCSIEMHIFNYKGNLYGERLRVELLRHLRNEREFASLEELKQHLAEDERRCKDIMAGIFGYED